MRRIWLTIGGIMVFVLLFRLYFAFQTNYYDYESYAAIRQIQHIEKTGMPIYDDGLSYSGRTFFFLPLFHYILAGIARVFGESFAFKIFPNILAATLPLFTYLVSREVTKNDPAALISALFSGFIPVFIYKTVIGISVYTLVLPIMSFLIFCFIKVKSSPFIPLFLAGVLLLFLTHPISIIFILGLIIYLAFVSIEHIKPGEAEKELVLSAGLFITWLTLLLYKKPFLEHGLLVIWQNIPKEVLSDYFSNFSILSSLYEIGLVPFVFGIYIIYRYVLRHKRKNIYLFMSLALCLLMLLWMKMIPLQTGLMMLGLILVFLSSQFFKLGLNYFSKTHFHNYKPILFMAILLAFLVTSLVPSLNMANKALQEAPSKDLIDAFEWIKLNTPEDSVVLAALKEGHLITGISYRKNVLDSTFLLVGDVEQRYSDARTIFTTKFETEAVALLNRYGVNYVILSQNSKSDYGIKGLSFTDNPLCFSLVYQNPSVMIFKSSCEVQAA